MKALVLLTLAVSWQRPPLPGRLSIDSTPPQAAITIDGQSTGKSTPFTFVVSPGDHYVALAQSGLPNCAKKVKAPVRPGFLTSIGCTASGWGDPTYK